MIPSIFPPTLRVCPRKLCLEILLVHLWQRPDVKDCLQGNLLSWLSANIRKHTTNKCFVRIKLKLNFFTSSLVILLSVSLVGVPQSLRTLVIWSISEIGLMMFTNVLELRVLTIISWKESSAGHEFCHNATHRPDVNWNKERILWRVWCPTLSDIQQVNIRLHFTTGEIGR